MRTIKKIHKPVNDPIADLVTYRVMPTRSVSYIDPFLFLNHHGPQVYPRQNQGLPFGPHPHRGIETVTFIFEGDIAHFDSSGEKSVITAGGVQWMTAGRGLIHSEVSSDEFKKEGGSLEILQLWINLPARLKMKEPFYKGLQKESIPSYISPDQQVTMNVISGEYQGIKGAFESVSNVFLSSVFMNEEGNLSLSVLNEENIFFYLVSGELIVNGQTISEKSLVEFENDNPQLEIAAKSKSRFLFGHARPFNEPVMAHGPFVMNTEEEIRQAYEDYQTGKFGKWMH